MLGRTLPAVAALLAAGILAVVASLSRYSDAYTWVAHTSDVRVVIGRAIGRLGIAPTVDATTCTALAKDLDELATQTADNQIQQQRMPALREARDQACRGASDRDLLRGLSAADAHESHLLMTRRGHLDTVRTWSLIALAATALGALAILVVARQIQRRAVAKIRESETRYRELSQKLEEISITDELTGLYNRRGFLVIAGQELGLAHRHEKRCAILFADLDGLKAINDKLGHEQGDHAIRAFGEVLRRTLRTTDVCARLGGDEFVALLYDVATDQLASVEGRLREALGAWNETSTTGIRLAASVGVSTLEPGDPRSLEVLIQEADQAMYLKKRASRAARASRPSLSPARSH